MIISAFVPVFKSSQVHNKINVHLAKALLIFHRQLLLPRIFSALLEFDLFLSGNSKNRARLSTIH